MQTLLRGLDALLVTNPTNIRYCTGFTGASPDERESFLIILKDKAFLFVNSLYGEQAKDRQWLHGYMVSWLKDKTVFHTSTFSREDPFTTLLGKLCAKERVKRLGYEETNLTVAEFGRFKKRLDALHLLPTDNRVEKLRMIKREDELLAIRKAAALTDQCFDHILLKLTPGVDEREIAWEIESFFHKKSATAAFSPIVAFGKNTSQPHYTTGSSARGGLAGNLALQGLPLRSQDIVLLDFGARVNSYCADMTRVVFIGKPKSEWRRAYETVLTAQSKALAYLQRTPNPSGRMADRIARSFIKNQGFPPYPHSLGHAVGLAIHEKPRLTVRKDANLLPGMVVTVEPGIYKEGSYGIRIEDLICLKKTGIEIISRSQKELTIL